MKRISVGAAGTGVWLFHLGQKEMLFKYILFARPSSILLRVCSVWGSSALLMAQGHSFCGCEACLWSTGSVYNRRVGAFSGDSRPSSRTGWTATVAGRADVFHQSYPVLLAIVPHHGLTFQSQLPFAFRTVPIRLTPSSDVTSTSPTRHARPRPYTSPGVTTPQRTSHQRCISPRSRGVRTKVRFGIHVGRRPHGGPPAGRLRRSEHARYNGRYIATARTTGLGTRSGDGPWGKFSRGRGPRFSRVEQAVPREPLARFGMSKGGNTCIVEMRYYTRY